MKQARAVRRVTLIGGVTAVLLWGAGKAPAAGSPGAAPVYAGAAPATQPRSLPAFFEPNRGQLNSAVRFLIHEPGYSLFLTDTSMVLSTAEGQVARLRLLGSNAHPRITGTGKLLGTVSYFIGRDARKWHRAIPTYGGVHYRDVYPGIDLAFQARRGVAEYDWLLGPDADPSRIRVRVENAGVTLRQDGSLILHTATHTFVQDRPTLYQDLAGTKRMIVGRFVLGHDHTVGIRVGRYDRSRPLVIDPRLKLLYSTYLGGGDDEYGYGIAVDGMGSSYIAGWTKSMNYPLCSAPPCSVPQPTYAGGQDAFVAKLSPDGTKLVYATYLGGSNSDIASGVGVDAFGRAYVTGWTTSTDFPICPGPGAGCASPGTPLQSQTSIQADQNAIFIAALNASGTKLIYSSYLGTDDITRGIAVDAAGDVYVTGTAGGGVTATDFPTCPGSDMRCATSGTALQPKYTGGNNVIVAKINASGTKLLYSTFVGGPGQELGDGIAIDTLGSAYVMGSAYTFPACPGPDPRCATNGTALQPTVKGSADMYMAKLTPNGQKLVYSTFVGGSNREDPLAVAVDAAGNAYAIGETLSTDFPSCPGSDPRCLTSGTSLQPSNHGPGNAYIVKLNADGSKLVYSTYFGGHDYGYPGGIAADAQGNTVFTIFARTNDLPVCPSAVSCTGSVAPLADNSHPDQAYIASLNPDGTRLRWATYGGVQAYTAVSEVALDSQGNAYVTGNIGASGLPTCPGPSPECASNGTALQPTAASGLDAFVLKVGVLPDPPTATPTPTPTATPTTTPTSKPTATHTPKPATKCPKHSSKKKGRCICKKGYTMKKGKCVKKK
jgi:hypothetical protein